MATLLKNGHGTDDLGPGAEFSSSVPLEPAHRVFALLVSRQ